MNYKHVIVISYDAFAAEDWSLAASLPHMALLLQRGTYTNQLRSVTPSLTYAAHTTMVTGYEPEEHGIAHNNPFQPFVREKDQAWFWFSQQIRKPTLYDLLQQHRMTTAALLWPVTAGANIRYHLPEVRAIGKENQVWKVLRYGSPMYCLELEMRFGSLRKGIEQPQLDHFTAEAAAYTFRKKQPHLMLVHWIELDEMKHHYGTNSPQAREAMHHTDEHLGRIVRAVKESGKWDETAFVVVGDHSQINLHTKVFLNRWLRDQGYLNVENRTFRAWFQSTGGGAYLHISPEEAGLLEVIERKLAIVSKDVGDCFRRTLHVNGRFFVEANPGYSFDDEWENFSTNTPWNATTQGATHGYSKEIEGYTSNLLVSGVDVNASIRLGNMDMVDIAPSIAALFGVKMQSAGRNCRPLWTIQ